MNEPERNKETEKDWNIKVAKQGKRQEKGKKE